MRVWLTIAVLAMACRRSDAPARGREEPALRSVADARAGDSSAPPALPPAPTPPEAIAAQCERIVDRYWHAVQPALPIIGLAGKPDLEKAYKDSSSAGRFRDDCRATTDPIRACLEHSPDILTALEPCGVKGFDIRPINLVGLSEVAPAQKASPAQQQRALARLVGDWADDKDALGVRIAADRSLTTSFTWYGKKQFHILLDYVGHMSVYDGHTFLDTFTYALDDDDSLSLCVNTMSYKHRPLAGGDDAFVTRLLDDILRFDHGACTVVRESGAIDKPGCAITRDADGRKALRLSFSGVPDQFYRLQPGMLVNPFCPVLHRKRH